MEAIAAGGCDRRRMPSTPALIRAVPAPGSGLAVASLVGGVAWVVDVAVIVAIDGPFDPLDSVLFFGGLVAVAVACVLAAVRVARARGRLLGAAAFAGLAALAWLVSTAGDALAHVLYSGTNVGLRQEGGVFAIGVVALAAGAWLRERRGVPRA